MKIGWTARPEGFKLASCHESKTVERAEELHELTTRTRYNKSRTMRNGWKK